MKKNWISTTIGIIFGALLIGAKLYYSHTVDVPTVIVAMFMVALGTVVADGGIIAFFRKNPLAEQGLEVGSSIVDAAAVSDPNNKWLQALHGLLTQLTDNVNALPAATAIAVANALPAPSGTTITTTVEEKIPVADPVIVAAPIIAAPAVALFNRFSGKPLAEDPEPVEAATEPTT